MAENTKIQWATHTFNHVRGCTKVAPGCANCYADAQSRRNPKTLGIWGPNGTRVVASEAMWREPLKWDREAEQQREAWVEDREERESLTFPGKPHRPRVFCASLADVFEDWAGQCKMSDGGWCVQHRQWGQPTGYGSCKLSGGNDAVKLDNVRARLFRLIDSTPNLDWLLLTKRPENVRRMTHDAWTEKVVGHVSQNEGDGRRWKRRENVWLGTSIASQEDADRNVPELLKCRDLCAKTFLSIEPLVGPVNLSDIDGGRMQCHWNVLSGSYTQEMWDGGLGIVSRSTHKVDWVIVGGESGPNARPCDVAWIRSIVRQCRGAGVPVFVKQLGARVYDNNGRSRCSWPALTQFQHHNGDADNEVEVILRDPKGGNPAEWPEDVRVREVPV